MQYSSTELFTNVDPCLSKELFKNALSLECSKKDVLRRNKFESSSQLNPGTPQSHIPTQNNKTELSI